MAATKWSSPSAGPLKGEVYPARDTTLGFRREAKLLAQLNHTHVVTRYGFDHGYIVEDRRRRTPNGSVRRARAPAPRRPMSRSANMRR